VEVVGVKCCKNCQDYSFCDDRSGCCEYCDYYSKSGCTFGSTLKKRDRLTEYENFKIGEKEYGDFFKAGAG